MKVTMAKIQWKILLPLVLLVIIAAGGFYLLYRLGYISHIGVSKTQDGWVCSGPIQYDWLYSGTMPVISSNNVVVVEKYERSFYIEGFKIAPCLKQFRRDVYYITALSLSHGHTVYRTKISINGHPLQVTSIWPWQENVVVWAYYQEEPGLFNKIFSITVLNNRGKILKQFPVTLPLEPMAVDEKNSVLLCWQEIDEKDFEQFLDPQILRVLELPSGTEKFQVKIEPLTHMITDKDGNLYINRLDLKNNEREEYNNKRLSSLSGYIEKYLIVPWQKLWSASVRPEKGYPVGLKYERDKLWYAIHDRDGGPFPEDRRKWIGGPLNCKTGEAVESQRKCDPYRIETEVNGKHYIITRIDDKVRVTVSSE